MEGDKHDFIPKYSNSQKLAQFCPSELFQFYYCLNYRLLKSKFRGINLLLLQTLLDDAIVAVQNRVSEGIFTHCCYPKNWIFYSRRKKNPWSVSFFFRKLVILMQQLTQLTLERQKKILPISSVFTISLFPVPFPCFAVRVIKTCLDGKFFESLRALHLKKIP